MKVGEIEEEDRHGNRHVSFQIERENRKEKKEKKVKRKQVKKKKKGYEGKERKMKGNDLDKKEERRKE